MRLRPPAYPLITVDPYFSVWARADKLTDENTVHWTNRPNKLTGIATIDGKEYRIIATSNKDIPAMTQTSVNVTAFSTEYTFEENGVKLTLTFTSPIIPNDLYLLSRPVSYLNVAKEITDRRKHTVSVKIAVSEEICMNKRGDDAVSVEVLTLAGKLNSVKLGTVSQKMLTRSGDDLRIEWGYFYLTAPNAEVGSYTEEYVTGENGEVKKEETFVYAESVLSSTPTLFSFAYDDIRSLEYFGDKLTAYWNRNGELITDEIAKAHADYKAVIKRCRAMDDDLFINAVRAGGEKYAELLELAFRQVLAAHKLAVDTDGEILFISKECFSNGCAATVDVSYPSIPMLLIYNPELVKGMLRPIYRYAASKAWTEEYGFDFAPHDVGQYPLLNGQVYGYDKETRVMSYDMQMPVEECGNMLIMEAAVAVATNDTSFASSHFEMLEQWVKYLIENGRDPENQLCTDDFAGHLAHNCNLSLKAIMGIAGLGIICGMNGDTKSQRKYIKLAREMALDWEKRASNGDGSYRLAFDKQGTFSMKYNIVWDKLFGTNVMPKAMLESEVASYYKHMNAYGLPLDSRQSYTKSDWLVWSATLAEDRRDFEAIVEPLWNAFNCSPSRAPMTDWYWTLTSLQRVSSHNPEIGFRNRTVQGGLFIKLLEYKGIMKVKLK